MTYTEAIELIQTNCGKETIKLSDDESLELSDLFKKGYSIDSELEHYFGALDDNGLSEEQVNWIKGHDFLFEFYVLANNIYLIVDDGKLDTSLSCQTKEFREKFYNILEKRYKKEEGN